jgi:U3 small nucleolar ribonucleoprotein protein LCP5
MAIETSVPALLEILTQSINSACEAAKDKVPSLLPPKDGISLLDVKNELFLSYLQNLVFLILLKIRNGRSRSEGEKDGDLKSSLVKKLHELSVYVEKGVLSLEKDLKYQIDKVVRAAEDAKVAADRAIQADRVATQNDGSSDSDEDKDSGADSDEGGETLKASEIDDLQYRPNPSAFVRPSFAEEEEAGHKRSEDGLYKPPRIQATAMPTAERREKEARRPNKSATLDEFIYTELSTAPLAEPSIGSGIVEGGRRSKSEKERQEEKERREYEETNYVRLPKESKKERAKKGRKDAGYGGEEWRDLGAGIDRIERLTKGKGGASSNVLERSRKRPTEDGPRGSGIEIVTGLKKRRKTEDTGRRDRGRR